MLEGAQGRFPEAEFRLNNGLELRTQLLGKLDKAVQSSTCVGDLLIRRPIGKLLKLPNPKECPIKNLTCISLTSEESIYSGYNVNIINTSMRMIAISPGGSESVSNSLTQGHDWYKLNLKYTPAI